MTDYKTGTREEWLAARLELLEAEKELTRCSDEFARRRQQLPWVRIDKEYVFDTDEGEQTLRDLFAGRSQLLVYHFMFGPTWTAGCATCTLHAESFDRAVIHLNQRDVTMVCASRGPLAKLNAYKQRMGLTVRWMSSLRSDFNYDFGVSLRAGADPDAVVFNFNTPWRRYNDEDAATTSTTRAERSRGCRGVTAGLEISRLSRRHAERAQRGPAAQSGGLGRPA